MPQAVEDADLGVAHHVRRQRPGRLHRHDAEHLEHVVLHHVAQGADALEVAGARGDHLAGVGVVLGQALLLGHGDLDVVDVLAVPERLEDAVGEAQHQQVLHRLLAEVMVDTIRLALRKGLGDGGDHFAGAVEVAADRLLDDDAGEGRLLVGVVDEAGALEPADAQVHEARRHGEVIDAAGGDAELLVDGLHAGLEADVGVGVVEAARHEEEGAGVVGPVALVEVLAREAVDAVAGAVADPLVGVALDLALGRQAEADDGEVRRQHAVHVEVVDGRQQLAPGQIAGRPEDDELARLRQHGPRRGLRQLAGGGAGFEFDGHRVSSMVASRVALARRSSSSVAETISGARTRPGSPGFAINAHRTSAAWPAPPSRRSPPRGAR